jgi:hypothetical protein
MARKQLFSFKYDGDTIYVDTAESSSDVYYRRNDNGTRYGAGIKYNADKGWFVRTSGTILKFADAEGYIRDLL